MSANKYGLNFLETIAKTTHEEEGAFCGTVEEIHQNSMGRINLLNKRELRDHVEDRQGLSLVNKDCIKERSVCFVTAIRGEQDMLILIELNANYIGLSL